MSRKWFALAAAVGSVMVVAGFSPAQEKSETHKLMEQINKKNTAINKAVRTQAAFEKAGAKNVAADADEMVKLLKKARDEKEPAQKVKKPYEDWTKLSDGMILATEDFSKVAAKGDQAAAKTSFNTVKAKCAECHKVFRVEDDE